MKSMHTDQKLHIISTSSEQSLVIGKRLGQHIQPGQLIELIGDLGGGKTTLVKGIAAGLGVTRTVTSPTFSIQRSYEVPSGGSLEHFDLYRLEDRDAVTQELEDTLADPRAVVVVEWTRPFIAALRPDRLVIELRWRAEDERVITMSATGKTSRALIEAMK